MFKSLLGALAISSAFVAVPASADALNGAGGTAIYPVLSIWAQDYNAKTGTQVNYQAIGSGGGIQQ
ncbi:MAG TPA: substrate-binding domain-containing protein, partial [Rhizomicrobium sp.]|nr:substrate-binding domain-containing protein [Rhizomicrobium sp.]